MERTDRPAEETPAPEESIDATPRRCCSAESEVARWVLQRLSAARSREDPAS